MKSWQSILINVCVTALVVFAAIKLFSPDIPPDKTGELRKALSKQMDTLQVKLDTIEEAISKQKKQVSLTTAPRGTSDDSEALSKLNEKLDRVILKLKLMENASSNSSRRLQGPALSRRPLMLPPQRIPSAATGGGNGNPTGWLENLSDEKRQEVQQVFEEHAVRIREKLPPPGPDGSLPDKETLAQAMKESDLLLKEELRAVLSDEEYQQFLESLPNPDGRAPALPGIKREPMN